ncbi:coniferyl aldehyde dehydrogenase [Pseudomonas sp. NPDC089996]|uniref:coniferyl aldehyde dehydrogenase n=1 Tax=Pseudomonas sp. NPDC089996 TaxID=3364474 RepID=UPI0037FB0CBD
MSTFEQPDAAQLQSLLNRQRRAFQADAPWSAAQRCALIDRAIGLLVDHHEAIVEAISADFGHRSPDFTRLAEIVLPIQVMKEARDQIARWMQPEPRTVAHGQAWIEYQPLGVVGIVTPWNFPVNMLFNCLVGVLAAGNRAMIKPSEFTPRTSALLARLIATTFAEDEVVVVNGDARLGQLFCSLPFDHLLFTGSTCVGRQVMKAAAENLVPVTLELGGKNPVIVSHGADLAKAAQKIMTGKVLNAGQICLAPDVVWVPQESLDAFVDAAEIALSEICPTLNDNPDYCSIINPQHVQRLKGYVLEARAAGVRVIELNPAGETLDHSPQCKLAPTLLINPGDDLQVMQDEIFGPLLVIKPYQDIGEIIAHINARPRPLALYYFGEDRHEEQQLLRHTHSGGVTINDVIRHAGVEDLPFGGVGASGMGAYHGIHGFRTFSHAKAVYRTVDLPDPARPPYSDALRQNISLMIRR